MKRIPLFLHYFFHVGLISCDNFNDPESPYEEKM